MTETARPVRDDRERIACRSQLLQRRRRIRKDFEAIRAEQPPERIRVPLDLVFGGADLEALEETRGELDLARAPLLRRRRRRADPLVAREDLVEDLVPPRRAVEPLRGEVIHHRAPAPVPFSMEDERIEEVERDGVDISQQA